MAYQKYENTVRLRSVNIRVSVEATANGPPAIVFTPGEKMVLPETLAITEHPGNMNIGVSSVQACTWRFKDVGSDLEYTVTVQIRWGRLIEEKEGISFGGKPDFVNDFNRESHNLHGVEYTIQSSTRPRKAKLFSQCDYAGRSAFRDKT
ncbi:hypothetical protein L248_1726 [Schleiferilactobacillus shenzhenensis LY-73]|uniref:Uncharacterized protein n=2 Tax=Schleiferilactobacillus shenzhenensis TaxID=1231337 RepID=U4TQ14_9LACO|nr:hypothetical protein L248_1726 [Schleiferilactobacillus shenzhenensis LY-73]